MTDLEKYVVEQIKKLIIKYEELEFIANVSESGYSVEFFVKVDGKKLQCYEMVDNGLLKEEDVDAFSEATSEYIRSTSEYKKGEMNKYHFTISS